MPSAAPYVLAISRSSTSVQIQWHTIPTSYRNGIIIGYRVHLVHSQNSHKAVNRTTDASVREVFINGLEKFTSYYFRVLAFTVKGDGKSSIPSVVTTDEDGRPSSIVIATEAVQVAGYPKNREFTNRVSYEEGANEKDTLRIGSLREGILRIGSLRAGYPKNKELTSRVTYEEGA